MATATVGPGEKVPPGRATYLGKPGPKPKPQSDKRTVQYSFRKTPVYEAWLKKFRDAKLAGADEGTVIDLALAHLARALRYEEAPPPLEPGLRPDESLLAWVTGLGRKQADAGEETMAREPG